MTTATPDTITRLDEETMAELQPPCEIVMGFLSASAHRCDRPAKWIVRTQCTHCCGTPAITLVCDDHLAMIRQPGVVITCASRHLVVRIEWESL